MVHSRVIASCAVLALGGNAEEAAQPLVTQVLVDEINAKQSSWTAHVNPAFAKATLADVRSYCGSILRDDPRFVADLAEKVEDGSEPETVPDSFDVRTAWPHCAPISGHIRDQSACGSCWAHGTTEALNDRHCIVTGDNKTFLSPIDVATNCNFIKDPDVCGWGMGCSGGLPHQAWAWFTKTGVVSGGDFYTTGFGTSCAPYSFPPCAQPYTQASAEYPQCPKKPYPTPNIGQKCSDAGYKKSYSEDKVFAKKAYMLGSINSSATGNVSIIQRDIVQYGSATAVIKIHVDFMTYKTGVYHNTTSKVIGGHAIKLLGWGVENGEDYWLVANSWNDAWGDHGFIKIKRGVNEVGIESEVSAGTAAGSEKPAQILV